MSTFLNTISNHDYFINLCTFNLKINIDFRFSSHRNFYRFIPHVRKNQYAIFCNFYIILTHFVRNGPHASRFNHNRHSNGWQTIFICNVAKNILNLCDFRGRRRFSVCHIGIDLLFFIGRRRGFNHIMLLAYFSIGKFYRF